MRPSTRLSPTCKEVLLEGLVEFHYHLIPNKIAGQIYHQIKRRRENLPNLCHVEKQTVQPPPVHILRDGGGSERWDPDIKRKPQFGCVAGQLRQILGLPELSESQNGDLLMSESSGWR